MTDPRSFSAQVYDLFEHKAVLDLCVARSQRYSNRPPALEVVWVVPRDTGPANLRFGDDPTMTQLFGIPIVVAPVDRPYLALRPAEPPAGDAGHVIRTGMDQAMAQYDHDADPYGAGVQLP